MTSKYAYKPTYLTVPAEVDSVTGVAAKGSTVWFTASIPDGEQTRPIPTPMKMARNRPRPIHIPITGRRSIRSIWTAGRAEVQGLTLPSVEEGWEGSSYVNNFQVMDDGSIWIFCMVNQYKTELPDDFDPNTQDEWAVSGQ